MDSQRRNGEGRVQRAEAVDVVYHTEENGRGERGVEGKPLEVVTHTNPRRGAGVEPRQLAVLEGDVVIEADKLHEHVADDADEVFDVAGFVFGWHSLYRRHWGADSFGRGSVA